MFVSNLLQSLSRRYSRDNNDANTSQVSLNSTDSRSNQSLSHIYPEEGLCEESTDDAHSRTGAAAFSDSQDYNPHIPYITQNNPKNSTSYVYSPKSSSFMGHNSQEPLVSRPGVSSDYFNDPIREDSLTLLKRSFPDAGNEPLYHPRSSTAAPTARKRLREHDEDIQRPSVISTTNDFSGSSNHEGFGEDSVERTKRPRFSVSAFGSPIYNKREETPDTSFSLFYPGKIMFGGASNYHARRNKVIPKKFSPRVRVNKESSNAATAESGDGGLSLAARRILNCIDKISTPLSNSKRMASVSSPLDASSFLSSPYEADFHKHRPVLKNRVLMPAAPPTSKLLTPSKVTTHNISGLIGQKPIRLQTSAGGSSVISPSTSRLAPSSRPPLVTAGACISSATLVTSSASFSSSTSSVSFQLPTFPVKSTGIASKSMTVSSISRGNENAPSTHCTFKPAVNQTVIPSVIKPSSSSHTVTTDPVIYTFSEPRVESSLASTDSTEEVPFTFSEPLCVLNDAEATDKSVPPSFGFGDKFVPPKGSWECGTCLLQNTSSTKCIACESPKSLSEPPAKIAVDLPVSASNSFGVSFQPPKGSWDCDVCLLQNKEDKLTCVACQAPKPTKVSSKPSQSPKEPPKNSDDAWNKFIPDSSSWECQICLLQNKGSVSKCAACEAVKPQKLTQTAPASSALMSSSSVASVVSSNTWGDSFKPSKGSWECDVCLIRNDSKASKCVACQTPKAKESFLSPLEKKISEREMIKENLTPSQFDNAKSVLNNNNNDFFSNAESRNISSSKLIMCGIDDKKTIKDWECHVCLVMNKGNAKKCVCCEALKPTQSRSSLVSEAITGNFKFGFSSKPVVSSTSVSSFLSSTFGNNSTNGKTEKSTIVGVSNGPLSSNFGLSSNNIQFPAQNSNASSNSPVLNISNLVTAASFSVQTSILNSASKVSFPNVSLLTSAASSTSSDTPSSLPSTGDVNANTNTPSVSFSFGISSSSDKVQSSSKPLFMLSGQPADSVTTSSKIVFPTLSTAEKPTSIGSTLTSASTATNLKNASPLAFSFGASGKKSENAGILTSSSISSTKSAGSQNIANVSATSSAPTFSFGKSDAKSSGTGLFTFGAMQQKSSSQSGNVNFGGAQDSSKSSPSFSFTGSKENKSESNSTGFSFSAPQNQSKSSSGIFTFGSQPETQLKSPSGFNFNTRKNEEKSTSGAFEFGKNEIKTKDASKGFAFSSQQEIKANISSGPFTFGAQDKSTPSGGFSFNTQGKETSGAFTFGAPSEKNASSGGFGFGNQENKTVPSGGFSFGNQKEKTAPSGVFSFGTQPENKSTPSGGFTFGSTQQNNANPSGGFNFGNQPSNANAGFNFGGQMENKAPTSFNFAAAAPNMPIFQFGQGNATGTSTAKMPDLSLPTFGSSAPTNMFNAGAAGVVAGQPQRRIKRALRRTNKP